MFSTFFLNVKWFLLSSRSADLPHEGPSFGIICRVSLIVSSGLWGTTLTEDTSGNRELFVRTTLRELVVYLVFLVDICLCKYESLSLFSLFSPHLIFLSALFRITKSFLQKV